MAATNSDTQPSGTTPTVTDAALRDQVIRREMGYRIRAAVALAHAYRDDPEKRGAAIEDQIERGTTHLAFALRLAEAH